MRRAAKVARKTGCMHGTPINIWKTAKSSLKTADYSAGSTRLWNCVERPANVASEPFNPFEL